MTFLNPLMLWSLAVLAPLLAIYLLKVRPRRKQSTAYFLWESIFQQRSTSALFSRLRDVWSLLLMALAAAAVCFALARPEWSTDNPDLLIVIDNSASMGAVDGNRTRIELAKNVAAELVAGLNGQQRAAIATINSRLSYQSHLSENPRELLNAINAIEVSDHELDVRALPGDNQMESEDLVTPQSTSTLASSDAESSQRPESNQARTLLLSDGCFDTQELPAKIELIKISQPLENVGIVAVDMAFLPGSTNRAAFYFQIASSFEASVSVDLMLSHVADDDHQLLQKVIPLTIEPGTSKPEIFEIDDAPDGRWLAKLEIYDALAIDNTASLAIHRPPPIRVAVDDTNRFFFENSVLAFSSAQGLMTLVQQQPEIVLASGSTPTAPLAIIFQPTGLSPWWSELGNEVEVGIVREVIVDHPALRYLEPTTMPFGTARPLTIPPGAQVLLADDRNCPLIYFARNADQAALIVNLDPAATEFYFSAWFPVLIHSAATWLSGRDTALAASYRTGTNVKVSDDQQIRMEQCGFVSLPFDNKTRKAAEANLPATKATMATVNGETIKSNSNQPQWLGCSLLSATETMLNNVQTQETVHSIRRGHSPSWWLTLVAIFLLAGESILYHRRKVG